MSIAGDLQDFCVLECSGCKQKKRTKEIKEFDCPKCQRKTTCAFQIDLIDGSGSTTASISGDLAEKLLSITAEDIYDTTSVKVTFRHVFIFYFWKRCPFTVQSIRHLNIAINRPKSLPKPTEMMMYFLLLSNFSIC